MSNVKGGTKTLHNRNPIERAKELIGQIKDYIKAGDGALDFTGLVKKLIRLIEIKEISLTEIGITEEDLKRFWQKTNKIVAKSCLKYARKNEDADIIRFYLNKIDGFMRRAKCSYEDLGTTQEEMQKLRLCVFANAQ